LNVSITGVRISPFFNMSSAKVPELMSVFSSFLIAFTHSCQTIPSFIFRISRIVFGAGSHELASPVVGCKWVWASVAQASARSKTVQAFAHPTIDATLTSGSSVSLISPSSISPSSVVVDSRFY